MTESEERRGPVAGQTERADPSDDPGLPAPAGSRGLDQTAPGDAPRPIGPIAVGLLLLVLFLVLLVVWMVAFRPT